MIQVEDRELLAFDTLAEQLKLPTTSQIARQSRDEFLDLCQLIPRRILRQLDPEDLLYAVYGFDSIRTIYAELKAQACLEWVFNHASSNFRLVRDQREEHFTSLINLHSAERIICLNPDLFPDAQADPRVWIIQNSNRLSNRQTGLLSGFPKVSVMDYHLWINLFNIKKPGVYNGNALLEDQMLLEKGTISRNEFEKKARRGLAKRFTAKEVEKLIRACIIHPNIPSNLGVILFSEEDVEFRKITVQFLQYLQTRPDFSLERALGPY